MREGQVLLQELEEHFYIPTSPVCLGYLLRRKVEIVGYQEHLVLNPPYLAFVCRARSVTRLLEACLYNAVWRFAVFLLLIVVQMYDIVFIQLNIAKVGVRVFFHESFHYLHVAAGLYPSDKFSIILVYGVKVVQGAETAVYNI